MKIKEIIEILKQMPQEKKLKYVFDGAVRYQVDAIWLSKNGDVIASDSCEYIRDDEDMPINYNSNQYDGFLSIGHYFKLYEKKGNKI